MTFLDTTAALQTVITATVVQPLLILFLGIFAGKLLERLLLFIVQELGLTTRNYESPIYTLKWLVYIASVLLALHSIGVLSITLWLLLTLVVGIILLSVLLGLKDFFPNFLSYHSVQRHKSGSVLHFVFGEAKVVKVQLTDMHVKLGEDDVYVPNSSVDRLLKR